MTSISMKWAEDNHACKEAREWFKGELNGKRSMSVSKLFSLLKQIDRIDWANWLVVRLMTHDQQIMYAIYAAEQVIEIYEARYPNDTRPRNAIQAAKTYLEDKTEANKDKVADATYAVADAAHAVYAVYAADAAHAAHAVYAVYAAYAAARAARAARATYATDAAADAAAYAARAAVSRNMRLKLLNYGLGLIGMHDLKRAVEEG